MIPAQYVSLGDRRHLSHAGELHSLSVSFGVLAERPR